MLKFLVDESSGSKVAEALIEKGYDAIYCGDYSPGVLDEEILKKAQNEKRVLITNDKDFGEAIFRHGKISHGVVFLRLKADKPANRVKATIALVKEVGEKLNRSFVVVTEDKLRIRHLK